MVCPPTILVCPSIPTAHRARVLLPALCALLGADERAEAALRVDHVRLPPERLAHRLACAKKAAQRVLPSRRPHSSESRAQTNSESVHGDAHARLRVSHRADRILGHQVVALLGPLGLLVLAASRAVAVEDGAEVAPLALLHRVLARALGRALVHAKDQLLLHVHLDGVELLKLGDALALERLAQNEQALLARDLDLHGVGHVGKFDIDRE